MAWLLLLYCAAPRANHRLRTVPPAQVVAYATEHDRQVLATAETLLDTAEHEREDSNSNAAALRRRQAQLPLRLGGLGLRSSLRTALAAYLASWADCLKPLSQRAQSNDFERLATQEPGATHCFAAALRTPSATRWRKVRGLQDSSRHVRVPPPNVYSQS